MVLFETDYEDYKIKMEEINIPTSFKREKLSEILNTRLNLEPEIKFDFTINNIYLRTSLSTFIKKHNISSENRVVIKYFPVSPPPDVISSLTTPDWVSCLSFNNNYLIAGLYDTNIKIYENDREIYSFSTQSINKYVSSCFINEVKRKMIDRNYLLLHNQ